MKKKINELSDRDLNNICNKYFNVSSGYDTCEGCPLKVKVIHCVKGLVEEKSQLTTKLVQVNQLLDECYDMEIEVE